MFLCTYCKATSGQPYGVAETKRLLHFWTTDRRGDDYHVECLENLQNQQGRSK